MGGVVGCLFQVWLQDGVWHADEQIDIATFISQRHSVFASAGYILWLSFISLRRVKVSFTQLCIAAGHTQSL